MAKLTTKKRNALSGKTFVFPKARKYPIPDKSHAANAKSRASAQGGSVKKKVFAAVKRKFGFKSGGIISYADRGQYSGNHSETSDAGDHKIADIGKSKPHGSFKSMGIKS